MGKLAKRLPTVLRRVAPVLLLLSALGLGPAQTRGSADQPVGPLAGVVSYYGFSPLVVRATGSQSVGFSVRTDATVTTAKIALQAGGEVSLAKNGTLFSTALSHAQALYGYTDADYNHNFVGQLYLYQGATQVGPYNLFVNVLDSRIPHVDSTITDVDVQQSPHVANLYLPGLYPATIDDAYVAQHFYARFADIYDFLSIVYVPSHFDNRYHFAVRNAVEGIGLSVFDNTAAYGATSHKLQGITTYPTSQFFDLGERGSVHEISHQWMNYLAAVPELQGVTPHWPVSSLAQGILGWQGGGFQGLEFPWQLTPIGGGDYQCVNVGPRPDFNAMELYLMGMLPSSSAGSYVVFTNQSQSCDTGVLHGPVQAVTAQDVIDAYGTRSPAYPFTQRTFKVATVVVSQYFLSDDEMDFFDYFAARGGATVPLRYSLGLVAGETWPFYLATGGRGCLVTTLSGLGGCYRDLLPITAR